MNHGIHRLVAVWLLVASGLGGWACSSPPPEHSVPPALARLEQTTGQVQWHPPKQTDWLPAGSGQALVIGARLRTGADGRTAVAFADGRRLLVQPESEFELRQKGDQLELSLVAGELEVSSGEEGADGFRLVFADDEEAIVLQRGRARLRRAGDGTVDLSAVPASQSGFRLKFGDETEVQVQREGHIRLGRESGGLVFKAILGTATLQRGGKTEEIQAGHSYRLTIGQGTITQREAIGTTLRDRKRAARIRTPNSTRFIRLNRREIALAPGTAIQNRGKGEVEVSDEAGGRLLLGPGSRAVFEGSFRSDQDREGVLTLDAGRARVVLRRQGGAGSTQEVVTPHGRIMASAEGLTAELTISAEKDETRIQVHTGKADVNRGGQIIPVSAGQKLTLRAEDPATRPTPLALPPVSAKEGIRTRVFYDRPISSVALRWSRPARPDRDRLEVSRTADFNHLILQEPIEGTAFGLAGLSPGRTFWRLVRGQESQPESGATGSIELLPDPGAKGRSGRTLTNVVQDTGVQTKIIFQGKAPALTLTWNAAAKAAKYRVRIFTGEDLETPILEQVVPATRLVLPAERLREGTYYWYQAALDTNGQALATSQMNKLVLAFDNATSLVRVDLPRTGARPVQGSIEVSGLAPRAAQITVNDRPILLGPEGRFNQVVGGVRPGALLLFHLKPLDRSDVYLLRHLGR